jgi:DNA mismatch repair protein MutS
MTLIDDYLSEQIKYEKKYGDNTIVLMQVGHFYEAYGVSNDEEKTNSANMTKLSDIMNIQMTRKNKNIPGNNRHNPLMIGVNIYSIDKYIQILLNANYTIVMISQTSDPPYVKREVTNIYSPGTNIEYSIKGDTNNLVSIFVEEINNQKTNKNILFIGASSIDLSTGKNIVFETHSNINDKNYALDELFRFIQVYDPKEVLFTKKNVSISNDKLSNYLELNNRIVHYKDADDLNKQFFNLNYQKQFFEKIFNNHGLLSVIEYLDLEQKTFGLLSYVFLLDFSYEHNATIVQKINKPDIWNSETQLCLTNNTINQLNLVDHTLQNVNTKYSSLFAVINNTSTNIGKRLLRDTLLNPIINKEEIESRYTIIDSLQKDNNYKKYEEYLNKISDLERLHRKLSLDLLQPADFSSLDISYDNVKEILSITDTIDCEKTRSLKPSKNDIQKFNDFIDEYSNDFDLQEIVKYHIDKISSSFFKRGVYEDIDNLQDKINNYKKIFNIFIEKLEPLIDDKNSKSNKYSLIKLENNERDGYFLTLTTKRSNSLKTNLAKKKYTFSINIGDINENIDATQFVYKNPAKSSTRIDSNFLKTLSNKLVNAEDRIRSVCRTRFLQRIKYYESKYGAHLKSIVNFVGNIDMFKSAAKTALIYGYIRPSIDINSEKSYIDFEEIRHPIIERIQNDINYVTNDIKLGNDKYGLLLFGTNASGKSSLMKAIGLNVILAQAGFYVAAKKFTYKPYKTLFTRINNNDNIFKGESSFAVEMSELRAILKRADNHSLVLGDELCSGTESISALSIFSSSVVKLNERNTTFIFATHLHELCKIRQVTELSTIRFAHLKVIFNEETGELVYDRKLQEGSGKAIYGLEVCKAMDMDSDFLLLSEQIRKDLIGQKQNILETKQSKYNSEIYVHECGICKSDAEDVHHIKFQSEADENNIIDEFLVKDSKSNLVSLCKECHNSVHNGNLEINGYVQTSNGVKLDYEYLDEKKMENKKKSRRKYSDLQIEIMRNIFQTNKTSKKDMCLFLEKNHDIKVSVTTFNKIINGNY